jgi:hypothetical protein
LSPSLAGQGLDFFFAAAEFVFAFFDLQPEAGEVPEVVEVEAADLAFIA